MRFNDDVPFEHVLRLLLEAIVDDEMSALERPHIVICAPLSDGAASYRGPFPTAIEALLAAEEESVLAAGDTESGVHFTVAPLYPG